MFSPTRREVAGTAMWRAIAIATTLLLITVSRLGSQEPQTTGSPPWAGAWHWLHDEQDGRLVLLGNGWFCGVFGLKERALPLGEHPTEAEAARLYRQMAGPFCGAVAEVRDDDGNVVMETVNAVGVNPTAVGSVARRSFDIVGDRMTSDVRGPDGTLRSTWTYQRLSDPGRSALAGAWELVAERQEGLLVMTDTEYRYVIASTERAEFSGSVRDLSDAAAALLYHASEAQGGSYAVSESLMTRRPAVAKDPREQGQEITLPFSLDGQTLTTGASDQQLTWRKLD